MRISDDRDRSFRERGMNIADTTATKNTIANGSFNIKPVHGIKRGLLEAATADYEAIATTFAVNAISDGKTRQQYSKHVGEVSDQVRQEVAKGNMTVKVIGSNLGGVAAEARNDVYQEGMND
jgi:hypothetical protein